MYHRRWFRSPVVGAVRSGVSVRFRLRSAGRPGGRALLCGATGSRCVT